jgi:hypothetical protein
MANNAKIIRRTPRLRPREVKLRNDIADRLARRQDTRDVARRLWACETGGCDECGDVCPIRAGHWFRKTSPALNRLFLGSSGGSNREFLLGRTTWGRQEGHLGDAGLEAVFKTLRRALDSLREPSLVAVGIIDAWWGPGEWSVGARVFVAVPPKIDLYRAFDHTKGIAGPLEVLPVSDVGVALKRLFGDAQVAKCSAWNFDDAVPKRSRRGEYYAWLAGLKPTARIFRYGCDRYFNRLKKQPRKIVLKPKKRHPSPWWLAPYQYDTHPINCECNICRNRQNR